MDKHQSDNVQKTNSTDNPTDVQDDVRRSTRDKKLTDKAKQNKEQELEEKFFTEHLDLLTLLKATQRTLQADDLDFECLSLQKEEIRTRHSALHQVLNELQEIQDETDAQIKESLDNISEVIVDITSKIVTVTSKNRSSAPSIRSISSKGSSRSSKRLAAAAETAALQEELAAQRRQNEKQKQLEQLELQEETRRKEAALKMAEIQRQLEEEKIEGRLKAQTAIMRVYDEDDDAASSITSVRQVKTSLNKARPPEDVAKERHKARPPEDVAKERPNPRQIFDRQQPAAISQQPNPLNPQAPTFYPTPSVFAITEALAQSRLPIPEPPTFTGDPLQYPDWLAAFTTLIERRGIPAGEKIHYLRKYLGGPAKEAVSGFFLLRSEIAYERAKEVLEQRFGNPFAISEAFRSRLDSWPKVTNKDFQGLQKFADFSQQCLIAQAEIGDLQILNDIREINRISSRLPEYITHRWNRIVAKMKKASKRYPDFSEFVSFLTEEADIANDPLLTSEATRTRERSHSHTNTKQRMTLSTTTSSPALQKQCILCKRQNHLLNDCKEFLRKNMEQRKEFIKAERICFACLERGHMSKHCSKRMQCKKCSKRHPSSLHDETIGKRREQSDKDENPSQKASTSTSPQTAVNHKIHGDEDNDLTSMIVPVYLSSSEKPEKEILVYALLDTMSNTTFLSEDIGEELNVMSQPTTLKLTTLTDEHFISTQKFEKLLVRGFHSSNKIALPSTFSRQSIPLDEAHIPTPETASRWPHLQSLQDKLAPKQECPVGLLIGYNCARALAPQQSILGRNEEPYAVRTELGWSIVGGPPSSSHSFDSFGHTYRTVCMEVEAPVNIKGVTFAYKSSLKEATASDFLQLMEKDFHEAAKTDAMSQEDKKFVKVVTDGIRQRDDGFYEMPLPFKDGPPSLPSNRQAAMSRLMGLKKQLEKKPKYKEHYLVFMNEILKRGDAEVVPTGQSRGHWYIPHHGVYHPKKPDKVRVVFDCSARYQGTSLNDHLLQGPDLINPLIGVILRFRKEPFAFMCDIEKMYHQFTVSESHQDYLRFLWWEDGDLMKTPVDHRMKVHLFGATSSPGCANFGLKRLAEDHKEISSEAADFLKKNFYVDDGLKCTSSEQEAIDLIHNAIRICAKGNLRLHKFVSNNENVISSVPQSERATVAEASLELGEQSSAIERALGLQWCINSDDFCFRLTLKDHPLTRRGILATVASVYDPLGLIAPLVLTGRLILQEMCKQKLDWDHPVPDELRPLWEKWRLEILKLDKVRIPRCFMPQDFGKATEVEVHHFSDASLSGYGQCSYLRLKNEDGQVHCSLAMAKARVSPLKMTTIPRLELQAATCSVKVSEILNKELDYSSMKNYFWTDSKVVLGYIRNETKRFHMFVANRIERIKQGSHADQWKYVASGDNPADHASRGLTTEELISSNWLTGPQFLLEENISSHEVDVEVSPEDAEVKSATVHAAQTHAKNYAFTTFEQRLTRFSSLESVVRAAAVIVKCCYKRKGLIIDEVQAKVVAKRNLIRAIQTEAFSDDRKQIKSGSFSPSKSNPLSQLDPFLDEHDLLRVGGRLKKAEMMYGAKHPIILPKESRCSKLVALHFHQETSHQGRNLTINAIRSSGYWIIGCRRVTSSLIGKCFHCLRLRGKTRGQQMADLPQERLEPSPPFTYCGLDCFGPFTIKEGRKELKRYGLILTCLASRSIHVEALDDMSTDAFMNALRCFIAIRGNVRLIRCDQGSNFIGAKHELKKSLGEMDRSQVAARLLKMDCEFQMNPPSSSHMGGVWERQIKNVRNVLNGILEQSGTQLNISSLRTFLYEAMAIVNSRPLTVDGLDSPDGPLPLTPNHVLTMKSGLIMPPPGRFEREDIYLQKRWRRVQYLTNLFWTRWRKEYLTALQPRKIWTDKKPNVTVGDIVLLKDDGICRTDWGIARVIETFPSDDGLVRKVKILMATPDLDKNGKSLHKRTILERPIHKLIILVPSSD